jgi:hypothetical protein
VSNDKSRFSVGANKGFQVVLDNGYKISVMFGWNNYCEHRDNNSLQYSNVRESSCHSSSDAEIAVFHPNGEAILGENWPAELCSSYDGYNGWQSTNDFAKIVAWVSSLPKPV